MIKITPGQPAAPVLKFQVIVLFTNAPVGADVVIGPNGARSKRLDELEFDHLVLKKRKVVGL